MEIRHVQSGAAESLAESLRVFAADRDSHGKQERARAARQAAQALLAGDATEFEDVLYIIGAPGRYTEYSGTRSEILSALDDFGQGCLHKGDVATARAAAIAYVEIESGDGAAHVGYLRYSVQ